MAKKTNKPLDTIEDVLDLEAQIDLSVCGTSLAGPEKSRFKHLGAHDSTPTPYFILDELFSHYSFDRTSHLLDVGCGTGRALAHFVRAGFPGRATGIELDPILAARTQRWAKRYPNLSVIEGNVLDVDLSLYSDFYLFNPFDQGILQQFIELVEVQAMRPFTLVHMSDNGDTWRYVGRPGWTEVASGTFSNYPNEGGRKIEIYDWPQHYTVWHHEPGW
ncbi:MAG: class I SAM-dependent methyltransferase [Atopobiaceae bacterium]|nr:class I SAM-dependent methyltransferase [Atopobiaceae bacterium]